MEPITADDTLSPVKSNDKNQGNYIMPPLTRNASDLLISESGDDYKPLSMLPRTGSILHCHPPAEVVRFFYTPSHIISRRAGMKDALIKSDEIKTILPDFSSHLAFV
jgi:hypothetical protein